MMKLSDIDASASAFSASELDMMADCLLKSEEIKKDNRVLEAVLEHAKKRSEKLTSLDQLREKLKVDIKKANRKADSDEDDEAEYGEG